MMEFSCPYHKRKNYMKKLQVPTMSEAKRQLGNDLAQVLMDECPEALRERLSLTNPLQGPGNLLWLSPSDLMIGKVVLKPPLTTKYMKALTHEGILLFGEKIEDQWMAAVELEKRLALDNLEELMVLLAERDKERAIQAMLEENEAKFKKYMETVNAEFEEVLVTELAALEASLRSYYENLIEEQIADCHQRQEDMVNDRIESAVNATVLELTHKFMADLQAQERELEAMFQARLRGQQERFQHALQHQEGVFDTVLKQLKHNLQCNNLASLMYVLCVERRKCATDQNVIMSAMNQQVQHLKKELEIKTVDLHKALCSLKEKQRQLKIREECLLGVLIQFQKFINFALKASPTQAEFLLSVEKMMTFELTQALERSQKNKKPPLTRLLMPWRKVSKESVTEDENMVLKYHDCLNEMGPPMKEIDDLYALYYKDRMYVREDFRNEVLQEPFKKPSNMLWSKDVEDLVNLIRQVNEKPQEIDEASIRSYHAASVCFLHDTAPDPVGLLAVRDSVQLQETRSPSVEVHSEMSRTKSPLQLLGATDSVTLIRDRNASVIKGSANASKTHTAPASSEETLQLRKESRRVTVAQSDNNSMQNLSDVTIQLNKHKTSIDSTHHANKMPSALRVKSNTGSSTDKRKSLDRTPITCPSAISRHVDSLELITRHNSSRQLKLKNLIMPKQQDDPTAPVQPILINAPSDSKDYPEVNFDRVAEAFSRVYSPEKPWNIYRKTSVGAPSIESPMPIVQPKQNFLKQIPVANIMGNKDMDSDNNFTTHRIHSIMDILKKDDSLIRMFTRCSQ